jgi:hypothetical protein
MDFLERSQAYVPAVIREWAAHAHGRDPWRTMPLDDLLGELPDVTSALLAVVGAREAGHEQRDPVALVDAARRHGAFRRRQGCAAPVLADDYEALRRALRSVLRTADVPPDRMAGVLYEALVALRQAARASALELNDEGEGWTETGPEQSRSGPEDS